MSKKKVQEPEEKPVNKADLPLSQLLLDCQKDKYHLVGWAIRWAHEVKKRDQSVEPAPEILNKALKEILAEQVSVQDIEKLPPIPKVEKKPLDLAAAAKAKMLESEGKGE